MFFSLAILVNNELNEITNLLQLLHKIKNENDEIVVLQDSSCDIETFNLIKNELIKYNCVIGERNLNNNFAEQKNYLNSLCSKDWIINLDADELITETFIDNIRELINTNPDIDSIAIPRINTLERISEEFLYVQKSMPTYSFLFNDKNHINFPDYQTRIYKNISSIEWKGEIHEVLTGNNSLSHIPADYVYEELFIIHKKDMYKQFLQNNKYLTISEDKRFKLNQYDTLIMKDYNMLDVDFELNETDTTHIIISKNNDYSYDSLNEFILNQVGKNKIIWITNNYVLFRYLSLINLSNPETIQPYLFDITNTYNNSEFYFGIIKFPNINGQNIYRYHFTLNREKLNLIIPSLFDLSDYNIL
jgi:hypothetical protein